MKRKSLQGIADATVLLPSSVPNGLDAVAEAFARQVRARSGDAGVPAARRSVELNIDSSLGAEAFAISDGSGGSVRVSGGDRRGVLYGVGKLLRESRFEPGRFVPGTWRGRSRPAKPVRGIYFATHFYNFYQTAPVGEIERYVEELALWGMNTLAVWYDMHHFNGFNDPEAVTFRERLRCILGAARRLGLDTWLLVVGNEAYADSPAGLRAAPGGGRGGYYDVAVCPAKPAGMDYILGVLGEYFDWARDLAPAAVCIWPYDQGGCGCPECQPWGARGFMRCVEEVGGLAREKLPGARIVLSTWYLDRAEWREAARHLREQPGLADALLMEYFWGDDAKGLVTEGVALGLPVVGFPEISMHGMFPWGGFGANPQPLRFHGEWQMRQAALAGGFPYSEGVFEDINKVLWLRMYWDAGVTVGTVLDEYITYEFGKADADAVREAVLTLERNHHFRWWPGKLDGAKILMDWFPSRGAAPQADPGAEDAFAALRQTDSGMPGWARQSWRWRIVYLRALLDAELKANGGSPTSACLEAFRELDRLYFVTDQTETVVRTPLGPVAGDRDVQSEATT